MGNRCYSNAVTGLKHGGLVYINVLETNATNRTYKVRTCSVSHHHHDIVEEGVQHISAFTSVDGDEDSCMVEPGTQGIGCFIGDVPYILGFFNPPQMNKTNTALAGTLGEGAGNEGAVPGSAAGKRDSVDPGDKVIQTKGKCKFTLRRSGIIEIECTKANRLVMLPSKNRVEWTCRNYSLTTDGISIESRNISSGLKTNATYYREEYKDYMAPKFIMTKERGTITASDGTLFEKIAIGPYKSGDKSIPQPAYVSFRYNNGKFFEAINPGGNTPIPTSASWYRGILDDGTYEETINSKTYSKKISPKGVIDWYTGNKAATLTISATGDTEWEQKGSAKVTVGKAVEFVFKDKLVLSTTGATSIKSGGDMSLDVTGDLSATAKGDIKLNNQLGAFVKTKGMSVQIGNSAVELVDIVTQMCQILSTTTAAGYGTPISSVALFAKLFAQLATLKG